MIPKAESLGRSYHRYQSSFLHQFSFGTYFLQFIVWFKPPLGAPPRREWFLYNYRTGKLLGKGKVSWITTSVRVEWGNVPKHLTKRIYNASLQMWRPTEK